MRIRILFADGTSTDSVVDEVRAIHDVLRHVSDEDVVRMGMDPRFARPEWLLITVLPVPPTCVRPPIHRKGAVDDDDLTHKLHEIVAACTSLRNDLVELCMISFTVQDGTQRNPNPDSMWRFLQYQIARFSDHTIQ